jgi:hypothetical protein
MPRRIHSIKHQPRKRKIRKVGGNPRLARRFSNEAINQIRHDFEKLKMSLRELSHKYLASKDNISKIINRKIYKNVD